MEASEVGCLASISKRWAARNVPGKQALPPLKRGQPHALGLVALGHDGGGAPRALSVYFQSPILAILLPDTRLGNHNPSHFMRLLFSLASACLTLVPPLEGGRADFE